MNAREQSMTKWCVCFMDLLYDQFNTDRFDICLFRYVYTMHVARVLRACGIWYSTAPGPLLLHLKHTFIQI